MAEYSITIDFKEVDAFLDKMGDQLDDKGANCVYAGYFEGMTYPDGFEVARNAWVQEKGTEHIPPRPFMTRAGADWKKWKFILEQQLDKGVEMPLALRRVGEQMQRSIVDSIDFGEWIPNSPATIKRKGSTKPLVDKGTLKGSTKYELGRDDGGA